MSARNRFMAKRLVLDVKNQGIRECIWENYEEKASEEISPRRSLQFTEEAKIQIFNALDTMERTKASEVVNDKNPDSHIIKKQLEKRVRRISSIIRNLPDHTILENQQLFNDPVVWEEILIHTAVEGAQGMTLVNRCNLFLRLLRTRPRDVTQHLPSGEAMACHLIRDVFQKSGMKADVRHTRPSSIPEGEEPISAFELFVFDFVLPDTDFNAATRKRLSRLLAEAEKAISSNH